MNAKVVKSAERTVAVFEFFARVRRPVTVSEIEEALQIPQSSASVLLRSLAELGYLECVLGTHKYRPTLRVTLLGDWLKPELPPDVLTERLDSLQYRTRETVCVGRRQGSEIQYVYVLRPDHGVQYYTTEGRRHPLATSAAGRALLSVLDDQVIRRIIRRNIGEKQLDLSEQRVMKAINDFRETGFAETDPSITPAREIHAIATLIPRKGRTEAISLTVAGPKSRMLRRRAEIMQIMREYLHHDQFNASAQQVAVGDCASAA